MSYGTKYKVPFKSISNIDYEILIDVQDYVGAITELTGGASPIMIETDSEDVLVPIRSSKATVSVYGSDYLQDLYTSNPQGIRVTLKKGASVEWLGFMTPDTFSQDFSKPDFIYDMECVSALNTLKYKKFAETGAKITFLQLIKNAALLAGYTELYLTTSITDASSGNVYANSSVAVANFYDELDEPMNYFEILEEVAKYLVCCTFVPYKNALYLLDYKAIKAGLNQYYKYNPATTDAPLTVTLADVVTTQSLGYTGTGATISRIAGKNKATVNCSLYEQENILPEFNDEGSIFLRGEPYNEIYTEGKTEVQRLGYIRYYNQPKFTCYKYLFSGGNTIINEHTIDVHGQEVGSCFVRTVDYDGYDFPVKLDFKNEVIVKAYEKLEQGKLIPSKTGKLITIKSDKNVIVTTETYSSINFAFRFIRRGLTDNQEKDRFQPREYPGINWSADMEIIGSCTLKIGNYIYNGTSWDAITPLNSEMTFAVPMPVKKGSAVFGSQIKVGNKNTYLTGLEDLSGYIVNPPNSTIIGKCEFTILMHDYVTQPVPQPGDYMFFYINDIKLDMAIQDMANIYGDWVKEDSKNDVVYENTISDDYIEEADEIDLKICTAPEKKLCLSSVMNATGFQGNIQSLALNEINIAEKLILSKVVSVFSKPRYVINPTVKNGLKPYSLITDGGLSGVTFVNCGGSEDVLMESVETNLIEL